MLTNKEAVIQAVERGGEIGVADLAARLRLDKGTCRKSGVEAAREGRIGARNNGKGYVFFPVGGRSREGSDMLPHEHYPPRLPGPPNRHQPEPIIDATFREVRIPPTSRALVAQPFDNRTTAAIARNAAASRVVGVSKPDGRIAAALNAAFVADPGGDETLSNLATAWRERAAATLAAEARVANERAAATRQRQADAQAAEAARKAEQERLKRLATLRAVTGMWPRGLPVSGNGTDLPVSGTEGPGYRNVSVGSRGPQAAEPLVSAEALRVSKPSRTQVRSAESPRPKDRVVNFFTGARPPARKSF